MTAIVFGFILNYSGSDLFICSAYYPRWWEVQIPSQRWLIVHQFSAWHVNFNIALWSFEPQVKGVHNLIDMALASPHSTPPHLLYTISIGVLNNKKAIQLVLPPIINSAAEYRGARPAKEGPIGPESAVGTGYSKSKWVSERLLEVASAKTAVNSVIIHVGQICGGPNGFWNENEWLPSLIQYSIHITCLPFSEQVSLIGWTGVFYNLTYWCIQSISWIPSTSAGRAITEIRHSSSWFVHLAHPHPVPWGTIFGAFSALLGVPLFPYSEWLACLEESGKATREKNDDLWNNPTLRIIEFFRTDSMGIASARIISLLLIDEAQKVSETLCDDNIPQLGIEDVKRWLDYWRNMGLLSQ